MGSRDKDGTVQHHQPPLLSSLVVRPSSSDGGGSAEKAGAGGRTSSAVEYEPGEFRRDPPSYSRADRYANEPGYRTRVGSASPVRRRAADRRYSPDIDRKGGPPRGREYGAPRDRGRLRENSPPLYGRDRVGVRPIGRGFDGPGFGPGPLRGEGVARNNPNVRPREGDWLCPDPLCGNLNFARREYCNKCRRFRYAAPGSPRRGYGGPPPPTRRPPGPPMDRSPGRFMNGYRSPPRSWARDGARDFGPGALPPPRNDDRFSDPMRRDRLGYPEEEYRDRSKFDRPMPMDWGHRDRGRDNFYNERRGFERRPMSPPLPPAPLPRDRWAHDARERSRSPIRGGPLPKEYRRDMYIEQGRDNRRVVGRGRIGDAY